MVKAPLQAVARDREKARLKCTYRVVQVEEVTMRGQGARRLVHMCIYVRDFWIHTLSLPLRWFMLWYTLPLFLSSLIEMCVRACVRARACLRVCVCMRECVCICVCMCVCIYTTLINARSRMCLCVSGNLHTLKSHNNGIITNTKMDKHLWKRAYLHKYPQIKPLALVSNWLNNNIDSSNHG